MQNVVVGQVTENRWGFGVRSITTGRLQVRPLNVVTKFSPMATQKVDDAQDTPKRPAGVAGNAGDQMPALPTTALPSASTPTHIDVVGQEIAFRPPRG